jgi:hypothetical protein
MAVDEEADRHSLGDVGLPFHAQGGRVALADDRRHPGRKLAVGKEMQRLHRDESLPRVGALGILSGEKAREQHDRVEQDQQAGTRHGEVMATEAPPHQSPIGGDGDAILGLLAVD